MNFHERRSNEKKRAVLNRLKYIADDIAQYHMEYFSNIPTLLFEVVLLNTLLNVFEYLKLIMHSEPSSSRSSRNSEAFASEFLENLEEMFPR